MGSLTKCELICRICELHKETNYKKAYLTHDEMLSMRKKDLVKYMKEQLL